GTGLVYVRTFDDCATLTGFMVKGLNFLLLISSIIAGFMFLQSGYRILTSQGNPSAVAEGREQLTNAVIGIVLIAVSFALVHFLNDGFALIDTGIDLLGPLR